ncbi:hypothetical protein, conserved [Babesia bigemina]|uniref:Uncharacterized protein n=1 Tax=Babesia bigemina TaxID=5866 RepID=A0A061DBA8_BABBI|nr:hypothetical protein, conserved [Babesia bigemina]CDR96194.1 hypothetical protein, conserved [Babesia bigemina]|eukprot:XP_012768380.1 hypothetical protein, conserved [Babesia bigemina]
MFASGVDVGKVVLPKFSLRSTRCYRSLNLKQKRNCIVAKLAEIPIHHQSPEELLKTVVGGKARFALFSVRNAGSNCIVVNRNFWLRCANAVLHHSNNFTATELIRIADSFGKVKHQDSSLFKEIAVRLLKCHESWRLNDIPRLLSAFRACSVFDEQLFSSALLIIQKNLESIGADDLTSILHSLTVTTEQALFRQILDDLVSPIFTKISNFSLEVDIQTHSNLTRRISLLF